MMKQAQQPHPVLCVIAGADANSSLQQLFGALAAEWPKGLTCVVPVTQGQDLSSVAASLTSQSLARSVYSVQTLANEAYTKPDSVLLVPGDSCTTIVDEQSSTLLIKVVEGSQTSLDCFLSGLASKIHHNLVAVVLPGAGCKSRQGICHSVQITSIR